MQLLPNICPSSKVVLSSLMGLSSRFINPGTILFVDLGLIGIKRCTTWTTRWSLTIMDCSSTWIHDIQYHSTMSTSCVNLNYMKTNASFIHKWILWIFVGWPKLFGGENVCYALVWKTQACSWAWHGWS